MFESFRSRFAVAALFAWAGLCPPQSSAAVYKCSDDAGAISYSQTPCPAKETTVRVTGVAAPRQPLDCGYANRFAVAIARDMRTGVASDQIFDRYGGLNAVSKGTINLVNYVYTHRANDTVSVERIAGLSEARCNAGSLGDVSCAALPVGFTQRLGGCNRAQPEGPETTPAATRAFSVPGPRPTSAAPAAPTRTERDAERTRQCIENYQRQLDRIDSKMRAGYSSRQGEKYRERQRDLKKRLNDC
jgi:hypothetical protein